MDVGAGLNAPQSDHKELIDNTEQPAGKIQRRRVAAPSEEAEPLSFKARRTMVVERQNVELIGGRIDNHIASCEGFRKLIIAVVGIAFSMFGATLGVIYNGMNNIESNLAVVDGRQQVVLSRIGQADAGMAAIRQESSERFKSVSDASSHNDAVINDRISSLVKELNELQRDFYSFKVQNSNGRDYEPPGGPIKRGR